MTVMAHTKSLDCYVLVLETAYREIIKGYKSVTPRDGQMAV